MGDTTLTSDDAAVTADGAGEGGAPIAAGATIGRYRIQEVVGAGGAGVVLSALDTELGRRVAIKILARDHAEARARLLREAQAMAKLSHPNVVTVHEIIRVGDGTGIVMELVDGVNLAAWRRDAPRTWREVVAVYIQAAHGLAAAHRMGLVHRDFKPGNALIDRDGVVRVTDFGLVRAAAEPTAPVAAAGDEPPPGSDVALTRAGTVLGTPAYMAPEQHAGEATDARTDQWALACSLYDALFDQRPFAGTSVSEIAASVLAGAIRDQPSDPRVPRHLRAALRKALARSPGDRFASVDDFVAAITPRRRSAWVLGGVAAVALAGSATAVVLASRPVDEGASCADLGAPFAETWNPDRAGVLATRFGEVDRSSTAIVVPRVTAALDRYRDDWVAARTRACVEARQGVSSPELLDRRRRCLDQRRIEVDTIVSAWLTADLEAVGGAIDVAGRLRPVSECDDPRESLPRPTDPAVLADVERGEEQVARAWALGELGWWERSQPLTEAAIAIAEQTAWTPLLARALTQHGRVLSHGQDKPGALTAFDRAATAAAQARDDQLLAEALVGRFWVLANDLGKPTDALAGRSYIELAIERAGNPPRIRANWLHHLAAAFYWLQRFDEALEAERASAELLRGLVSSDNVALVDSLATLAVIQTNRGELDEAEQLLRQVLAGDIAKYGPNHRTVAEDYVNLGNLDQRRSGLVAAEAQWAKAFEITRAAGGGNWTSAVNTGAARFQLGRWSTVLEPLTLGLAWAEQEAPGESVPVAVAHYELAFALLSLGELERAADHANRSVAAARAIKAPQLVQSLGTAAVVALARGDQAGARRLVTEALATEGLRSPRVVQVEGELALLERDCKTARAKLAQLIEVAAERGYEVMITDATIGIATCQLAAGEAAAAVAALQARVKRLEEVGAEPAALVRVRAALARAHDPR